VFVFARIFDPGYFPSRRREPENVESKVLNYVKVENGRRFANVIEGCGKIICHWFLSPGGNEHRLKTAMISSATNSATCAVAKPY
jgi:hypothetical protein